MTAKERVKRVKMRLNGKSRSITIYRDALMLLGAPEYICILQSKVGTSLVLSPCDKEEHLAFAIPDKNTWTKDTHFRFYSTGFVRDFLRHNGYGKEGSCVLSGEYDPEKNVIYFTKAEQKK